MAHFSSIFSRFLKKEELAFREIYYEYHQKLYLHAMEFVRDHEVAEEIRNDALLKVYDHGPFTDAKHLRNFAFEVTRNMCLNHRRYLKLREQYYEKYRDTLSESEDLLETNLHNAERTSILYKHIQTLPDKVKKVIMLFYFNSLTAREIAEQENKSVDTIRKQLQQGRDALKKHINIDKLLLIIYYIMFCT